MALTHQILFNNYDLTELIEEHDEGRPVRLNAQVAPKRHGAIISEVPVYGPRQIRMRGSVYGSGADPVQDLRDTMNDLQEACNNRRARLTMFTDRYYNAYCASFNWGYVKGSALQVAQFAVEFVCDDPFAYSAADPTDVVQTLTTSDEAIDITNNIYRKSFNLTYGGNAFTYPNIIVTAGASVEVIHVVIRNLTTGYLQQYTGTIAVLKSLIISNSGFTVRNDGEDDLVNFSGNFIALEPGINAMEIEGSAPATYTFDFVERFI